MSFQPDMPVSGAIARLFIYPVKSCAGVEVEQALLTESGLDLDRAWMVVDSDGMFVTQREEPRMALIRPQIKTEELVLRAPGMLALHLTIDAVEAPTTVTVWQDTLAAWDMGAIAAQWLTDFLGRPCRLARFDPDVERVADSAWTSGAKVLHQFADGFPLLVLSEASLEGLNERLASAGHASAQIERFRPNVVVSGMAAHDEDRIDSLWIRGEDEGKSESDMPPDINRDVHLQHVKPCARCAIPDIDPTNAAASHSVSDTLQVYRQDRRLGGAVTFGMNAIVRGGTGHMLRVGQLVKANWRFD